MSEPPAVCCVSGEAGPRSASPWRDGGGWGMGCPELGGVARHPHFLACGTGHTRARLRSASGQREAETAPAQMGRGALRAQGSDTGLGRASCARGSLLSQGDSATCPLGAPTDSRVTQASEPWHGARLSPPRPGLGRRRRSALPSAWLFGVPPTGTCGRQQGRGAPCRFWGSVLLIPSQELRSARLLLGPRPHLGLRPPPRLGSGLPRAGSGARADLGVSLGQHTFPGAGQRGPIARSLRSPGPATCSLSLWL